MLLECTEKGGGSRGFKEIRGEAESCFAEGNKCMDEIEEGIIGRRRGVGISSCES